MTGVLRVTLLGCGSSGGVPRADGDWGACDPANPKNRRLRCSILVERAENRAALDRGAATQILVDTSPDLREQALAHNIKRLDAVLYTHDHADQVHGIDDLRVFALRARARMPVHMSAETADVLTARFHYAFVSPSGSPYPAILDAHQLPPFGETFTIPGPGGPLPVTPFEVEHGRISATGFRFGPIAYTPDVSAMPDAAFAALRGAQAWIVDALRDTPHPTHANVATALEWLDRAATPHGVLTNLHIDLDYDALSARLPEGRIAAYDGLSLIADDEGITLEARP